jgi:prophage DNA circulation protein
MRAEDPTSREIEEFVQLWADAGLSRRKIATVADASAHQAALDAEFGTLAASAANVQDLVLALVDGTGTVEDAVQEGADRARYRTDTALGLVNEAKRLLYKQAVAFLNTNGATLAAEANTAGAYQVQGWIERYVLGIPDPEPVPVPEVLTKHEGGRATMV